MDNQHSRVLLFLSYPFTIMSIASFDPFSLKNITDHSRLGYKLQEIIDYAESRFRAILTNLYHDIGEDDDGRPKWVQTLLHRELVSIID